jgi:hypothetical protein
MTYHLQGGEEIAEYVIDPTALLALTLHNSSASSVAKMLAAAESCADEISDFRGRLLRLLQHDAAQLIPRKNSRAASARAGLPLSGPEFPSRDDPDSKSVLRFTVTGVRIPPSPPVEI